MWQLTDLQFAPCVYPALDQSLPNPSCSADKELFSPQVVANAVAALSEISESHPNSNLLDLNPQNINKLLTALNECTEWGQIFILDCLSNYNPKDDREAQRCVGFLGALGGCWGCCSSERISDDRALWQHK